MFGQGASHGLCLWLLRHRAHLEGLLRKTGFQILDRELHLRELAIELLGGAAVPLALQAGDLKAQLLELEFLREDERFGGFELGAALGKRGVTLEENAF
jgi:hypothetical protein